MNNLTAQWMGKPILDPEDHTDLETRAAVYEFGNKVPRHEAEKRAHEDYVKDRRLRAAAHHLQGARAAQAVGEMEQAQKHGMLYELHLKALGLDPVGPVPKEVEAQMNPPDKHSLYRFKAHAGDLFAVQDHEKEKGEEMAKAERSCSWRLGERRCKNPGSRKVGEKWWCHHHEKHGDTK